MLKPHVTKTFYTIIAYTFATMLSTHLTLVSLCRGKRPLPDHACVAFTDGAILAPHVMQLKLNLASRLVFREA